MVLDHVVWAAALVQLHRQGLLQEVNDSWQHMMLLAGSQGQTNTS